MSSWVTVQTFSSREEATLAQGFLEQNGIPALILADDTGGMRPSLAFVSGAQLRVEEKNAATARTLLAGEGGDSGPA